MKNFVFFDVDNVLVQGQSQKLLVKYLYDKNKINIFLLIKVYIWFLLYRCHLVKDVIAIRNKSFSAFKGWSFEEAKYLFDDFYEKIIRPKLFLESIKIIEEHIVNGDEVILLSATLSEIVDRIKDSIGVRYSISTELEVRDGKYTGNISGMVPYGENKLLMMKSFLQDKDIDKSNVFAYADHSSDIHILEFSTNPKVVNPDKKLRKIALKRKWPIYDF